MDDKLQKLAEEFKLRSERFSEMAEQRAWMDGGITSQIYNAVAEAWEIAYTNLIELIESEEEELYYG